jgi:hypothetical protein
LLAAAQDEFSRLLLSLLVRSSPALGTALSLDSSPAPGQLAIKATRGRGNATTLVVDGSTCQPLLMKWQRPTNRGDLIREARAKDATSPLSALMSKLGPATGTREIKTEFSDYSIADGIKVPMKWVTHVGDLPTTEVTVTAFEANPQLRDDEFTGPGGRD